jgi:hypothetical protein
MRTTRGSSWLPLAVVLAACMLFLGSAFGEQHRFETTKTKRTQGSAHAGKVKDGDFQSFLRTIDSSLYCESNCCAAWTSCDGGSIMCTDGYCEASCPEGDYAQFWCALD